MVHPTLDVGVRMWSSIRCDGKKKGNSFRIAYARHAFMSSQSSNMAEKLDPKETISILELTVSHMWSIAALVEVLERKGLLNQTGSPQGHHGVASAYTEG